MGTVLDGRYRLTAHLASGGMGAIFRAEHVYMRKELALKILRPDLSALPDIAERFRREAEIAAALEHENIVRVTDFGRSPEGWLFFAMELLEGESLFERLRREGALPPAEVVRILVQVCRGLEAAHAGGVVHRDLKPENIFLSSRPAGLVKILDFGIAKLTDPSISSDTEVGVVVGTPEYLSPEQAMGTAVDGRADVYAVGLIGWRMLAGRHPFQGSDARAMLMMQASRPVPPLAEAQPELAAFPCLLAAVARACAKVPADRHAGAGDLRIHLEACLGALEQQADASPTAIRPWNEALTPVPRRRLATHVPSDTITLTGARPGISQAASQPGYVRARRAAAWARRHAVAIGLAIAVALLAPASLRVVRWLDQRPATRAQELLAAGDAEGARDLLEPAIAQHPADARLRVLQGRALHRIRGQAAAGVDAYAAALDLDPASLDGAALSDLAGDFASEPETAARSAQLLARAGPEAVSAVLAATRTGPGTARLRALELARELGAEARLDCVAAYAPLLRDDDCDVRRAAARRLADIGGADAVPALAALAQETRRVKGIFGLAQQVPACGAAEAQSALERIEARK